MNVENDELSQHDPYELANQYAQYYGISRETGETNETFKNRVAGILRGMGRIIEAHEAFSGTRYEDAQSQDGLATTWAGIVGAVASEMRPISAAQRDPYQQIGDDLAIGSSLSSIDNPSTVAEIFRALGPSAGMDYISTLRRKD